MGPLLNEPAISLRVQEHEEPGIEVRVNFGVFAGRHATPAEIDELATALREFVPEFSVVSEERTSSPTRSRRRCIRLSSRCRACMSRTIPIF